MHFTGAAALLTASASIVSAGSIRGFNSGSTGDDGSPKTQADFQAEFSNQKNIAGSNGVFNSCRLYTMIQAATSTDPISAIPAAIAENTGLLLGMWASAGQDDFNLELAALANSIEQYGSQLADITQGISVGSEDLYRVSVTGIANSMGLPGAGPDVVAGYIAQVRKAVAGTVLANVPIGHVDTWNAWTNSSNSAVIDAVDWLGIDEYPYYQSQDSNPVSASKALFDAALGKTQAAAGSKPLWITETGYPTSGPTVGQAVASVENAKTYWDQVYCSMPADTPVYWYIQYQAAGSNTANFGVTGNSLSTTPLYDLSCKAVSNTTSSSSSSSSSRSSTTSTATKTGTAAGNTSSGTGIATATRSRSISTSISIASSTSTLDGVQTTGSTTVLPLITAAPSDSTTMSTLTTPTQTPTSTLSPVNNSAGNVQIYTLALLIVPAVLAFMM